MWMVSGTLSSLEDLVPNGNYTVELNFQAARQDVPAANNFPMAPLTVSAAVSVN